MVMDTGIHAGALRGRETETVEGDDVVPSGSEEPVARHSVAVPTNAEQVRAFGVDTASKT
jgi:hypothetical protein